MKQFKGQSLAEYVLLLVLVASAAILVLRLFGFSLRQAYCDVGIALGFAQACETTYCEDDFSSGKDSWATNNGDSPTGNWQFNDGQLCATGNSAIYNKCSQSMTPSDYTVKLDSINLERGDGYGIYFRSDVVDGKVNGYTFQYDPGLGAIVFRKWVDGRELSPFAVHRVPSNYDWYGKPQDVEVKVSGDTFTAYINGEPVLTAQDSTYPTGSAGIRTWDNTKFCMDGFGITPNQP